MPIPGFSRLRLAALVATLSVATVADGPMSAQSATSAGIGNWPQWRGPNRDNLSPDTGLLKGWDADGPALVFQSAGLGAGFSSVAVVGSRIYTMGDHGGDQSVLALSAADGKLIWKTKVGPGLGRRLSRAARHAHGGRRPGVCGRHRRRRRRGRDGDGEGALAEEPDPRLRRADHVQLEVQRVAARRRRSGDRDPRGAQRRARRARQAHRESGVEVVDSRPGREGT